MSPLGLGTIYPMYLQFTYTIEKYFKFGKVLINCGTSIVIDVVAALPRKCFLSIVIVATVHSGFDI